MAERFTFPQSGDRDDAEHFASLAGQDNLTEHVERGMGFTVDYGVPEVTVATGKAFVKISSGTASSSGDTILDLNYVVQIPQQTVSLTDSATNYIYLEPNIGTDDSGTINAYTSTQSSPSLLIGTIDTSADTSDERNRRPTGEFQNLFVRDGDIECGHNSGGDVRIAGTLTENASL